MDVGIIDDFDVGFMYGFDKGFVHSFGVGLDGLVDGSDDDLYVGFFAKQLDHYTSTFFSRLLLGSFQDLVGMTLWITLYILFCECS